MKSNRTGISLMKITRPYMGTFFTVIVEDEGYSIDLLESVFSEIQRIEHIFSRFLEDSELSILNRTGHLIHASEELVFLMEKALFYAEISEGRYNPAILPILELYSKVSNIDEIPRLIDELIPLTDYRGIVIDRKSKSVKLIRQGAKIDLSSIAKGYAVDRAIEVLRSKGVSMGLVEGGGDIRTLDGKGGDYWRIGVRDPFTRKIMFILKIFNKAVATSGIYEKFLRNDHRFPHIIDGRTGRPVEEIVSSTVISDNATDADALATMILITGREGLELLQDYKLGEAMIIYKDKKIEMTDGFSEYIVE